MVGINFNWPLSFGQYVFIDLLKGWPTYYLNRICLFRNRDFTGPIAECCRIGQCRRMSPHRLCPN